MKYFLLFLTFTVNAVEFSRDIQPILARHCYSCHGKDKQKGKLRLDIRESALKILAPGKAQDSELLKRISHKDTDEVMPPEGKKQLSDNEKTLLTKWISEGAEYKKHWSFTALKSPAVPKIKNKSAANEIDLFVLEKLRKNGLSFNPPAPRHILIRRLALDLTGLPPGQKLAEGFISGEINYSEAVDKLLASDDYGRHMARLWLDAARYGDTNGLSYDNSRPIWPYRDWVVESFNRNMPYDSFIIEQLAGDLLPDPSNSQLVATGFLRCNVSMNEQGSIEEEYIVKYAQERLETVSSVFMGLTVKCASCHDHKYDPVSQKEYYQMLSFFNNIDGKAVGDIVKPSDKPVANVLPAAVENEIERERENINSIQSKMRLIKKQSGEEFRNWHETQMKSPPESFSFLINLEALYSFEEKSGNRCKNFISGENGTIHRGQKWIKGKYGSCLSFNSWSYIFGGAEGDFEINQKFSAGAWIRPRSLSRGTIVGKQIVDKGWSLQIQGGKLVLVLSSGGSDKIYVESEKLLKQDLWNHVTFSYDGSGQASGVSLFLNNIPVKMKVLSDKFKGSLRNNVALSIAGHGGAGLIVDTDIDEVFVYPGEMDISKIKMMSGFNPASILIATPHDELTGVQKETLHNYFLENFQANYKNLYAKVKKFEENTLKTSLKYPKTLICRERKGIRPGHILKLGRYDQPMEEVFRNVPAFLPSLKGRFPLNRLGFAKWLTADDHPLTARVAANRTWQQIFNRGLHQNPEDFGIQGGFPFQSELLDFIAVFLKNNNWDQKALIRLIVSSSMYKQSSHVSPEMFRKDPENRFLARAPRYRLHAEVLRDQALAISGLLSENKGGPGVFPYQPAGYWEASSSGVSNTRNYIQSKGKELHYRSIYTFWKRNSPPPNMVLLDAPGRQSCSLRRSVSNTALQALVLLNDPQFTECADALAAEIPGTDVEKMINFVFNRILFRDATLQESRRIKVFLQTNDWNTLCQSLMNLDSFLTRE